MRGKLLSSYMIVQFLGFGGGQFILNLAPPEESTLFIVISILVSLSLVPMMFVAPEKPTPPSKQKLPIIELFRVANFGVISVFLLGVSHATIFGLSGYYGFLAGLQTSDIAIMVMLFITGGAMGQWPLGKLSDQKDRRAVAGVSCGVAACFMLVLASIGTSNLMIFFVMVFLSGALAIPPYSITVAHVNDALPREKMVAASGTLYLIHGMGSFLGPISAALSIAVLGTKGFFIFLSIVNFILAGFASYRIIVRNIDSTHKKLIRLLPFRATAISTRNVVYAKPVEENTDQ
jgi:MFS family permease